MKILVKGGANQLEAVRVELSSESNLFFHYTHDLDAKSFAEVQVRDQCISITHKPPAFQQIISLRQYEDLAPQYTAHV